MIHFNIVAINRAIARLVTRGWSEASGGTRRGFNPGIKWEQSRDGRKALEAEFEDVSYLVGRVLSLSRLNDYSERFQKKYIRDIKAHDIYPEQFHIYVYYGIFLKIMEISLK